MEDLATAELELEEPGSSVLGWAADLISQASRDSEVARAMAAATKRAVRAPRKGATLEGGLWRSVIVDRTLVLVRRTFARVAGGKKKKMHTAARAF